MTPRSDMQNINRWAGSDTLPSTETESRRLRAFGVLFCRKQNSCWVEQLSSEFRPCTKLTTTVMNTCSSFHLKDNFVGKLFSKPFTATTCVAQKVVVTRSVPFRLKTKVNKRSSRPSCDCVVQQTHKRDRMFEEVTLQHIGPGCHFSGNLDQISLDVGEMQS